MGVIVANSRSKLRCDHPDCHTESYYVWGENDGQSAVLRVMQNHGWQCTGNGRTYCPEHAWGKAGPTLPAPTARASQTSQASQAFQFDQTVIIVEPRTLSDGSSTFGVRVVKDGQSMRIRCLNERQAKAFAEKFKDLLNSESRETARTY